MFGTLCLEENLELLRRFVESPLLEDVSERGDSEEPVVEGVDVGASETSDCSVSVAGGWVSPSSSSSVDVLEAGDISCSLDPVDVDAADRSADVVDGCDRLTECTDLCLGARRIADAGVTMTSCGGCGGGRVGRGGGSGPFLLNRASFDVTTNIFARGRRIFPSVSSFRTALVTIVST